MKNTNDTECSSIFIVKLLVYSVTIIKFNPSGVGMKPTPQDVIIRIKTELSFMSMLSASGLAI